MNDDKTPPYDPMDCWLFERMVPGAWERLTPAQQQALAALARRQLDFPVLKERRRDSLDFREVSVLSVREALARAFMAGAGAPPPV